MGQGGGRADGWRIEWEKGDAKKKGDGGGVKVKYETEGDVGERWNFDVSKFLKYKLFKAFLF